MERRTKKAGRLVLVWLMFCLLSFLLACGGGGDSACSSVSVVGSNSQATCNGNNTQQNGNGDLTEDQAADICCTQEKVDSLMDDDCLKELGFSDTNLCRADSSNDSSSGPVTTLEF